MDLNPYYGLIDNTNETRMMHEMTGKIKTVSDLVGEYERTHPNGHFFDPETLKFFGERRSEMRLLKGTVHVTSICGEEHECYVLSSVQRPPAPLKKHRKYHYFDVETFEDVCV